MHRENMNEIKMLERNTTESHNRHAIYAIIVVRRSRQSHRRQAICSITLYQSFTLVVFKIISSRGLDVFCINVLGVRIDHGNVISNTSRKYRRRQ